MRLTERRIQTICLVALTFVAGGAALYWLRAVLVPLVLAGFLAILLSPALDLMDRRLRLPRSLSLVLTLLLAGGVLGLIGLLITASVGQLRDKSDLYQTRAEELVDWAVEVVPFEKLNVNPEEVLQEAEEGVLAALLKLAGELQSLISDGILVLLFLTFIVLGNARPATGVAGEVVEAIKVYLSTKFFLSALTGVLVGGVLYLFGIDLALVFGVFTFLLNFIPNVGSIIAVLLPLPIIVFTPDLSPTGRILAFAIPGGIQFAVGNVIEPRLMGTKVDLHPVVVLAALVSWGMLWGIVGALLAVPLTAALRILLDKVELTRPIANLLAGHLPGDPPASPA